MADKEQLQILKEGAESWNAWRRDNPYTKIRLSRARFDDPHPWAHLIGPVAPATLSGTDLKLDGADFTYAYLSCAFIPRADLSWANLSYADLSYADLSGADLSHAILDDANLSHAKFADANLSSAHLINADLTRANLEGADLSHTFLTNARLTCANLSGADFTYAYLRGANLSDAHLTCARFVNTNLSDASLEGCRVYGVSAWALTLDGANQKNLRITPYNEPAITVDDLEVAQFIYLILNNEKLRYVINTITTKVVLILGCFTLERKAILDAVRDELRQLDYLPIIFDFDQPSTRDLTETISTLAHMARFIIADITEPRSIPQELHAIIPHLPSVPVQPLILASENAYSMFEHFKRYYWVLETHTYESCEKLIGELKEKVIAPAEAKAKELCGF
jgi:uncharacterized protein YjbI with pentapeptide repeats